MSFLSNIFGREKNNKPSPDLSVYEAIVDQITISNTLRSELKADLKKAFEDPKSFYDDNNEFILSERRLKYPTDTSVTPKYVLLDTLQDNGEMAEADWKEDESEIRILLAEISMAKNYVITISNDDQYEDAETEEVFKFIDERELKPQGYSIVLLDIDSDSFVFTIVPTTIEKEVKAMFEKIK